MLLHKIFLMVLFMEKIGDRNKIREFVNKVDVITYEFGDDDDETLHKIIKYGFFTKTFYK